VIFWTIAVLGVYLLIILTIGFRSGRGAGKSAESFFVANRNLNWMQEAMAVFTTIASAGALVGSTGLFYKDGAVMLGFIMAYTFLMPITYWFVGVRLRRLGRARGYQTQSAFIGDYYQSGFLRWCVSLFGVVFSIPYFLVGPVAMGILLNKFTGFPYWAGVLAFVIVAMVYTIKGGLRAVANTDVFHGALLVLFLLAVVFTLVAHAGGWVSILDSPKAMVPTSGIGLKQFFAWIPYLGLVTFCWPDRAFRMFAVKDDANLRKGCVISGAMMTAASVGFLAIGLAANKIVPGIKNTDTSLASALQVAAVWLVPWFVMNAWGSGMSTFTAGMLSTANIFIKDIFEPWYVRMYKIPLGEKRDKLIVGAARWFMIFLGATTLVACFYPPPFIWSLINLTLGLFLQFCPMFLYGLMWKGTTRIGVQASFVTGVTLHILWSFFYKPPFGTIAGINALFFSTIVFFVVSFLTSDKKEDLDEREAMRAIANGLNDQPGTTASLSNPILAK
jgi:Na+/proline symporter